MIHAVQTLQSATTRNHIKIHASTKDEPGSTDWLINGYPAKILLWSAEEWANLTEHPEDAREYPNGSWCALRLD